MHLFVDNLTNVDFSYLDHQRGLVGETWLASASLDGALDSQGMVCDFGIVKKTLRRWLDEQLDHRLLVPILSPHLQLQKNAGGIALTWALHSGGQICVSGPEQAFALVEAEAINADSVAAWSIRQLTIAFPASIERLNLCFASEEISTPYYHYSHGLKKHAGNCQRIAHGHRSRIEIYLDGERCPEWERRWAERWRDIYLGTREDLCNDSSEQVLHFAYSAQQGEFSLEIPAERCELVECDTTVEQLAQHIADTIARAQPDTEVRVRAYEGLGKGAVAAAKI
ncbi:6-carboxytetrahydropterin synthase [Microbulbifer thermotolerans]|uniref:6-carboxy-5,6,7,8-tetrahydropterin synthase n=1 Tax=Microbulbifer thermotolerans TaxID=252514 RepID=A0AB35HZ47_MICTH|nr:6-carboxytetrahydropterin synthase [Microbulbifer thermotolerans]MCX2802798.1 6-carboxytetrahydropterin synthase [Microbulbifer thermotolerans]MCX2841755.1 6-carboxytetrahydropterin synthase [Microbulbifer thermotolerans]WKT59505.1 6-carboxytetrahydropterin synthase [Microbulbifer thermotolerans]